MFRAPNTSFLIKSFAFLAVLVTIGFKLQLTYILPIDDKACIMKTEFDSEREMKLIDKWLNKVQNADWKPNVLFLIGDDMRPEMGAYIHEDFPWLEPSMLTPNLDALAGKGLLFRRAYCQFAWCNPSRSSFLTSRRPDSTLVFNNTVFFRNQNPSFVTLPQYFKENGYQTHGMGKVYHLMNVAGDMDEPLSWTGNMLRLKGKELVPEDRDIVWHGVKDQERDGKLLQDEKVTEVAIQTLRNIANAKGTAGQKPFFIAVGMKKPHLNWFFPDHFKDLYPLDKISLPQNPTASPKLPDIAWYTSNELRYLPSLKNYSNVWTKSKPLPDLLLREIRMAYYSCISYIDHLIGQILDELEVLGLADDTIVSFIGDHGFHLGEHGIVGKNTAFEVTNHAPMIIRIPGVTDIGIVTDKLVELVDLYPTLAQLAGLPQVPYCPAGEQSRQVSLCTEGTSLVPLFRNPMTSTWKDRVFYQYPHQLPTRGPHCMGYSVRTQQHRYTEWVLYDYTRGHEANWSHLCGAELYDHHSDPHEVHNIAEDRNAISLRHALSDLLKQGWSQALPQ